MKYFKRIQSLMLTTVMLGSIFTATTGWTEGAGNFHFWDGDSYAIDFTGTLSDFHNTDSHADKTKAMIHAGTTCVMDIAEPSVDADGRGTSLKIASSGTTYTTMLLSSGEKEALTDSYQVNFSVLTQGVEASVDTGTSSALVHLARIDREGNVIIGVQKSSGEAVCKVDTGKWVDFEEIIVLRDGVNRLYYTVKQGDATLAAGSVAMTLLTGKPLDGFSLKRVGVKRYAAATDDNYSTPTYFDDLSIVSYEGELPEPELPEPEPPEEDNTLFQVDFNGATRESLISDYAYNDNSRNDAEFRPCTDGDPHGDSMYFPKGVSGGSGYAFSFATAAKGPKRSLTSGVYKFSFSIYPNGDTPIVGLDAGAAGTYVPLASIVNGTARHSNITDTTGATVLCSGLADNSWVDFETIVDLNRSRVCYTITQNGEIKANRVTVPLAEHLGGAWSGDYKFARLAIRTKNTSQNGYYFDDLKLQEISEFPTIGEQFVTFTDATGNIVSAADENLLVLPALKKINLDFGYPVDADSVEGITVTPAVAFTAFVDGSNCVLTMGELLKEDMTYTVTVPPSVKSGEKTLGKTFSVRFLTDKANTLTVLQGVKRNGEILTDISGVKANDTLTVETGAVNMSGADMKFTVVTAYYHGNRMLATDCYTETVANGSALENVSFVVPTAAAGMTSLRCFLWDELGNLAAYCPYLEIGEPPVVADASATEMHSVQGKIPYSVEYEKTASRVRIRGAAADGEYVVLQVLKAGGDFQTMPQEEDVLYHNQATAVDGAFAFEIEFDDSSEGAHEAVLASNGAEERTFLSLTLVTPEHFQELYSALNTAAGEDDDKEFERLINENLENLNFHFALTEGKNLSAELADYRAYVKNHPLDTNQAEQNCQIFKTYMMAYALNHQDISNIDTSVDQLYFADSSLLTQYHKLAPDAVVQRYFTKKMYDNTINNLEEFEIAFKRALIFTGVRYGDGYGDVREVLTAYGDVIGITDSASDKVYSGLLGNDYGSEAALTAAYRALQSGSGSGTGSANNSTNGYKGSGGGSYGSTSGGYSVENTPGQKEPEQLKVRFWDIEGVDWAAEAILALADQGIIHGTEPGMFEPDKAVTREEFIKILVGAMGLANTEYSHNAFIDVPEDAWYSSYVNIAQENGIVQGIGGGVFGVGQTITREDMVTMIYHALKLRNVALSSGVPNFADASDISDYACTAVSALCELGAVNGVTAAEFQPRGSATRAQAAKVIYSVLGYLQ